MTTTENELEPSYAALTHFTKLGRDDSLVFRADSVDDLLADIKEAAELSKELVEAGKTLKEAFQVVKEKAEGTPRSPSGGPASGAPSARGVPEGRSRRPGSRPAAKGPKVDVPLSDEVCDCGEPYKDLNGMTYQKGPKEGELYPYRYYASCNNRDCKPFGGHE